MKNFSRKTLKDVHNFIANLIAIIFLITSRFPIISYTDTFFTQEDKTVPQKRTLNIQIKQD